MRKVCIFIVFYLLPGLDTYSQWEYFGSSSDFKEQLREAQYDTARLRPVRAVRMRKNFLHQVKKATHALPGKEDEGNTF